MFTNRVSSDLSLSRRQRRGWAEPPAMTQTSIDMHRREVISLLGSTAASSLLSPLHARAQQPALPVIGYLSARSREDTGHLIAAFQQGLAENDYVDGRNVTIEYRFALGEYDKLPAMARELVRLPATVIATTGGEPSALAAKAATSVIPIVFALGSDPVKQGLTASINRPGGNATGITSLTNEMEPKRLGLLRELVPHARTIGLLLNPSFTQAESQLSDLQQAARAMNVEIVVLRANTDQEVDAAFEAITQQRLPALFVAANPFFDTRRKKLVALAARTAVPAIYHFREYAEDGGLMSYGLNFPDVYRLTGVYTGKVLKGTKAAELPVMQATKFEFVINLKTAKALGVQISDNLLSLADDVIE
jgi:putative ABC transport system substrate-binding protein